MPESHPVRLVAYGERNDPSWLVPCRRVLPACLSQLPLGVKGASRLVSPRGPFEKSLFSGWRGAVVYAEDYVGYSPSVKAAFAEPEIITRNGKPVSVIIPIKEYEELLERLEDADDIAFLKKARRKPLRYRPLEDVLADLAKK